MISCEVFAPSRNSVGNQTTMSSTQNAKNQAWLICVDTQAANRSNPVTSLRSVYAAGHGIGVD